METRIYKFKYKKCILILTLLLTFKSCKTDEYKLCKINIATSGIGCESECPFEAVSIEKDGSLKYYGGFFVKNQGYFTGEVDESVWNSVSLNFTNFLENLDTTKYQKTDHPIFEIYINDCNTESSLKIDSGKLHPEDFNKLRSFMNLPMETQTLKPSDSLAFETTIQYYVIPLKY